MYPRIALVGGKEQLVSVDCLVGIQEYLSMKHHIINIEGVINMEELSPSLLLIHDSQYSCPVKLIVNSPGGDLSAIFLLYDTIKMMKAPVYTLGRYCGSGAALILAAGTRRYLAPHARMMLHLPSGQIGGDTRDWDIYHAEMAKYKDSVVQILQECGVKRTRDDILRDIDRDIWFNPQEAIDYGLADEIMTPEIMASWLKEEKDV